MRARAVLDLIRRDLEMDSDTWSQAFVTEYAIGYWEGLPPDLTPEDQLEKLLEYLVGATARMDAWQRQSVGTPAFGKFRRAYMRSREIILAAMGHLLDNLSMDERVGRGVERLDRVFSEWPWMLADDPTGIVDLLFIHIFDLPREFPTQRIEASRRIYREMGLEHTFDGYTELWLESLGLACHSKANEQLITLWRQTAAGRREGQQASERIRPPVPHVVHDWRGQRPFWVVNTPGMDMEAELDHAKIFSPADFLPSNLIEGDTIILDPIYDPRPRGEDNSGWLVIRIRATGATTVLVILAVLN